ncbi:MAG: glucosaminidase domain-containing protein [Bacteroidales bacterium]|nr:glucosaminidase domain-containing protein [Bacteroidales bacterium]
MKHLLPIILCFAFVSSVQSPQEKYIEQYAAVAVREMERSGVPASITLAQGLLESRAGQSPLAKEGNNHFGIKCHNDWTGRKMYQDDDARGECFRVYPAPERSFEDHSDFLRYRDRYKGLFELKRTDYKGWARGLKKAGYATDPAYAEKLIKVIEDYRLYRFDTKAESVPEAPLEIEAPRKYEAQSSKDGRERTAYREELHFATSRAVMARNGVPFVVSLKGDTYASLANECGLFVREILLYNDLKSDTGLEEGTVVYLQMKKRKGEKGLDKYIADHDGEQLRDIAQRFAIRLSSLCKMNSLREDAVLQEGDSIVLL